MTTFDRYIGAQLHCHSSIEGPASIGAHCYEAHRAGVEVVWLTDHDTRIALCLGGPFITEFDFEAPALLTAVQRTATGGGTVMRSVGWSIRRSDPRLDPVTLSLTGETAYSGTQSMCLAAVAGATTGVATVSDPGSRGGGGGAAGAGDDPSGSDEDWQEVVAEFKADAKLHTRPLLADVTLGLAVRLEGDVGPDAEAWIDVVLSEQPPDLRLARLRYRLDPTPATGGGPATERERRDQTRYRTCRLVRDVPHGRWVHLTLRPEADAEVAGLGGADNALTGLRIGLRLRRRAQLRFFVDDLTIAHEHAGDALHARQRALAGELGRQNGVVCHVAQEISQAGQHKNTWARPCRCWTTPRIRGASARRTAWPGHAGTARPSVSTIPSCPISTTTSIRRGASGRWPSCSNATHAHRAWGADTLEVGFPIGRYGFDLDLHLRLWDGLTARGVFLVGSGSSDAHSARVGWQAGNNFATYIRATATDEASLIRGLRSGDVYLADPVRFRSRLSVQDHAGRRMGAIVGDDATAEREVVLNVEDGQPDWYLCWVVDGVRREPLPIPTGRWQHIQRLARPARNGRPPTVSCVRAEIWEGLPSNTAPAITTAATATDTATPARCIALTNPICYVEGPLPDDVPAPRLARG